MISRSNHSNIPKFDLSAEKFLARKMTGELYRKLSGNRSLPSGRTYWTLCNQQSNTYSIDENGIERASEIVQMCRSKLITKGQYYGIDYNKDYIKKNKKTHPEAHWLCGSWDEVIQQEYDLFKTAGIVYYDSTHTVSSPKGVQIIANTLSMCSKNTLVAANVMLVDGHSNKKFDEDFLPNQIWKSIAPKNKLNGLTLHDTCYEYKTRQVRMATFFFHNFKGVK